MSDDSTISMTRGEPYVLITLGENVDWTVKGGNGLKSPEDVLLMMMASLASLTGLTPAQEEALVAMVDVHRAARGDRLLADAITDVPVPAAPVHPADPDELAFGEDPA